MRLWLVSSGKDVTGVDIEIFLSYNYFMNTQTLPKPGQRIKCIGMVGDPAPISPNSRGTVLKVQEVMGIVHIEVAWDSGRSLSLVSSLDSWSVLAL